MTDLEALAEWVSGLQEPQVPEAQHALARLRILDTLGLIAAGSAQQAGASMATWARAGGESGTGATNLATGATCGPATAALVHGTLAHARDFDDTFPDSVIHPGSTVIPTALAVAEAHGLPLSAATTAIAAGYETTARLGRLAGRGFHARGFHATSVIGPVAAAATAAMLLRLDAGRTADAMGLATSMSGGTMAFLADGGWSKWLHTGWSAHGGITAAELAANGFRGPRHALEHAQGLYGAFLGRVPADLGGSLADSLGSDWAGSGAQFKLYPCAHIIHPYIEAALAERQQRGLTATDVARIECRLPQWAMPIVAEPPERKVAPRNDLEAIASLPFMVAAALCDGEVTLATLGADRLARVDILALAERIVCVADATLTTGFDGTMEIVRASGESRVVDARLPPADAERVKAKFRTNSALGRMGRAAEVEASVLTGTIAVRDLMPMAVLA